MGNNTDWIVNLPDGNYFWSVQAIDHSFAASAFSWEQTFTILNVNVDEQKQLPVMISLQGTDQLIVKLPFEGNASIRITDIKGLNVVSAEFNNETILYTTNWAKGIYIVKISLPGYPSYVTKIAK
jgi:6-phosphogluconolactonase (cycloisomerase 2 family)